MTDEGVGEVAGGGVTVWQGKEARHYGRILLLIILTFATGIAFGEEAWGSFFYLVLQAFTLLLALRTSEASFRTKLISLLIVVPVVVGAGLAALAEGDLRQGVVGISGAALVLITVGAIGREVVEHPDVSGRTVMGALCIYLLIGLFYAYLEQFLGAVSSDGFFAGQVDATPSVYIYFSYVTLTTVGFGDFVARGSIGRSVAVTEAIIGQLYLVTVVGFTIGNFAGRQREDRRNDEGSPNNDQS